VSAKVCFTVEFKSEVDRFKMPDEERETPSICENPIRISSPSDSRKRVEAHRIGSDGSLTGGKCRAYPPTPLGEHVYPGRQEGALRTS
jgi:hypothetical protein